MEDGPEMQALRKHYGDLCKNIDPLLLGIRLYSMNAISSSVRDNASAMILTKMERAAMLLEAVENAVKVDPECFFTLIRALECEAETNHLAKSLKETYDEFKGPQQLEPKPSASYQVAASKSTFPDQTLSLRNLSAELQTVTNWYLLGLQLGIASGDLDTIEQQHQSHDRKMVELMKFWLKQDASWDKLVSALSRMGQHTTAKQIQDKYIDKKETHPAAASMVFRKYTAILLRAIEDPEELTLYLYSNGIIHADVLDNIVSVGKSRSAKIIHLLSVLRDQITVDPANLDIILDVLKEQRSPALLQVAERMEAEYTQAK